jgi:phospholipid/cholesterol/gamma-HCH transport system permease protein
VTSIPLDDSAGARRSTSRASGDYVAAGRRLLGRWELLVTASYWLAWLSFSRRTAMGTGIQRDFDQLGMNALRLIVPAALLVGIIATFQVATQLSQFGAQSLSVRAIGWFAARELGPVVVALLVVTRSASGIAGELATMRANGEIDALRAMGLNPVKYLVAPKLAALLIAVPCLTIIADALIVLGGWLGSVTILDVSTRFYFDQFRSAFELRDLFIGLVKSVVFAYGIAIVACYEGLNIEGKMHGIGAAASRAVVYTVLGVLAGDTIINAVFYFIPLFA